MTKKFIENYHWFSDNANHLASLKLPFLFDAKMLVPKEGLPWGLGLMLLLINAIIFQCREVSAIG